MPNNNLIPLNWDEDAVRLLSLIAPGDEEKARVWWETYAPAAYLAILESGVLDDRDNLPRTDDEFDVWLQENMREGESEEKKKKWWIAGVFLFFTSWRFVTMDNFTIPQQTVRGVLDRTLFNARTEAQQLCISLQGGGVGLADWQIRMADIVKTVHIASAVLARGGFGRMSPDAWADAQTNVQVQLNYLDNFANQIGTGQQRLDGTLCRRMQMYLQAGRGTYHATEIKIMSDRGYDVYRNILGSAEHCGECVGETGKRWVSLGELIPIGDRICLTNCHCSYEYGFAADLE